MSQYIRTDPILGGVHVVTSLHEMVHEDRIFHSSTPVLAIAAASVQNFLFRNAAKEAHLVWEVTSSKEVHISLYEGPTVTVAGTARAPMNADRDGANTTAVTVFSQSTIAANGTFLEAKVLGSATAGGQIGGETRGLGEWIARASEDYLLVLDVQAVNTNVAVNWRFYEEE